MPELSVIMATYNENLGFLKTCIDSVLRQTFNDFEFIIVVEPEEANLVFLEGIAGIDKRVKIFKNESRLRVAGSRNRAILESSGKYIAIVDGDDYCASTRFEKQLKFFASNPELSIVGSNLFLIDENGNIVGERKYPQVHKKIKEEFLLTMAVANPAIIVMKKDIEEVGFFDSQFNKAEDFELWLRFLAHNKRMHNLQENLVYHRISTNPNKRRGSIHWKNNFIARKRHSKFIWPFHQRLLSNFFYYVISQIPDSLLANLFNFKIVNKIKDIRLN